MVNSMEWENTLHQRVKLSLENGKKERESNGWKRTKFRQLTFEFQ